MLRVGGDIGDRLPRQSTFVEHPLVMIFDRWNESVTGNLVAERQLRRVFRLAKSRTVNVTGRVWQGDCGASATASIRVNGVGYLLEPTTVRT
ncbi:MAG: hypothetical protein R2715_08495 [Ilumatobacteraceae bacterium]